jgi:hypothetical protein
MTTKEIAEAAGVSVDTVQRVAKKIYPGMFGQGKRLAFVMEEAIEIMKALRKKNFVDLPQGASELPQSAEVVTKSDLAVLIGPIVAETIKQLIPLIRGVEITGKPEPMKLASELPPLDPRRELNMLARDAGRIMGDYREPYNQIYKHAYYRIGVNLRERAKNRGIDVLDYAAEAGYLPQLVAIAREIFK